MQIVVFRVGRDDYALPVEQVREIVPYRAPRALPVTRPWELGVISLRDHVVPVWDLALRLGLQVSPPGAATVLVLVDGREPVAFVVDGIGGIHDVADDAFEPLPLFPDALGVVHLRGELVVLLDLGKLRGLRQPEAGHPARSESEPRPAPGPQPEPGSSPQRPSVAGPDASPVPSDILEGLPKRELQRRARAAGIAGRSSMTREQLIAALRRR
jgi:purine-binding chemotaxis protein CheW